MSKKNLLIFLVVILVFSFLGCYKDKTNSIDINLYYNENLFKSVEELKILVNEYEKYSGRKINFIKFKNEEEVKREISKENESSILLLDSYTFFNFVSNKHLRDLSYLYKEKNIKEKFNVITNLYGIDRGRYFGFGFMPYSLELIYNKNMLDNLGIKVEENNMGTLILELSKKNIEIPTYINSAYTKELLFSSLIANDTIIYELLNEGLSGRLIDKIDNIEGSQIIMDKAKEFYDMGILKSSNFKEYDEKIIEKFNNEEIPVLLTTTLSSSKITSKEGIYLVNKFPIENKVNAPIGVDAIITSSVGREKREEVDSFFRFLIQSDVFVKLGERGNVTGNKKGDSYLNGVQSEMAESINNGALVNGFYLNILSKERLNKVQKEFSNIMNGIYDGNEMERIKRK